jgi:hypothetical protein
MKRKSKRKTTSLGYIGARLSFAIMFDGETYATEMFYGGGTRKKINNELYVSDDEARTVLSDEVEWRTLNVQDRFIRNARSESIPTQLCLFSEVIA